VRLVYGGKGLKTISGKFTYIDPSVYSLAVAMYVMFVLILCTECAKI